MISSQRAIVVYLDGTKVETTLTQWSLSQWAVFCARQKIPFNMEDPGLLALTMTRYAAWAEIHRNRGAGAIVPTFDTWDMTVDEVETPDEPDPVFPTQPEASAGPSGT